MSSTNPNPYHGLPLDDMSGGERAVRVDGGARMAPAGTAESARFQVLDMVPTAERGRPAPQTYVMPDPQQPDLAERAAAAANEMRYGGDDVVSEVRMPSGATMLAMVEPAVLGTFERARTTTRLTPGEAARQVVAEARDTARAMLAQAKDVISAERGQAFRSGRAEGHAQGMAEADAETASLVSTCELIGVHVMEERARVLAEQEADTVELAIAIAERIVGAALDVTPELVIEACRGAMRKAFQRETMQVLAHPDDLARLREAGPQLAAELGGVEHLDFLEERRLDRGSIIVRTPAGEIDATIAGKADRIEQALREGIEARRAERRAAG